MALDDSAYEAQVKLAFKALVTAADAADPDALEADATGDMITITATKTGEKVIVNTQRAVHQVWVAGKGAGVHFSLSADGRWLDDKGKGLELLAWVDECVAAATGQHLPFGAKPSGR
ncbi:MAG: iron donor protein CyaY [Archangium sp.]|nr:iron donor protein CyaY [Archangium sp.]